jgi:hypothetical protein
MRPLATCHFVKFALQALSIFKLWAGQYFPRLSVLVLLHALASLLATAPAESVVMPMPAFLGIQWSIPTYSSKCNFNSASLLVALSSCLSKRCLGTAPGPTHGGLKESDILSSTQYTVTVTVMDSFSKLCRCYYKQPDNSMLSSS